jgi:hypothetical protein
MESNHFELDSRILLKILRTLGQLSLRYYRHYVGEINYGVLSLTLKGPELIVGYGALLSGCRVRLYFEANDCVISRTRPVPGTPPICSIITSPAHNAARLWGG